jgi:hypothetical protein
MKLIYLLPLALLLACDKSDCANKNPVFDKNAPGTVAYNNELVKQLKEKDDVTFYHAGYEAYGNREFMKVNIQGTDLCATALLDITQNEDMDQYRKVKGQSYAHSRIFGLKYNIVQNDSSYSFTFVDMTWLVD